MKKMLSLMVLSLSLFAGSLTTFTARTSANASEVNANFSELDSRTKNITSLNDNIGIGTITPKGTLHIKSINTDKTFILESAYPSSENNILTIVDSDNDDWHINARGANFDDFVISAANIGNYLIIKN